MAGSIAERFAAFTAALDYDDLPEPVVAKSKAALLFNLGVAVPSYQEETILAARRAVLEQYPAGENASATLLGHRDRVSPIGAALFNGMLGHRRAQDDTYVAVHMGSIVTPAALAAAELSECNGRELLTALVAGYEVAAAVTERYGERITERGFRPSSTIAIFGAAAAASRLLKLSEDQVRRAIGMCTSMSMGVTQCWLDGSMEWILHMGMAAQSGLLSALLARGDFPSAINGFEGERGYLNAFHGSADGASDVGNDLGREWRILDVTFKPYPIGMAAHGTVKATFGLLKEHSLNHEDVERVEIRMNPFNASYPGHASVGPFPTPVSVIISSPFCVALALVERRITLDGLQLIDDPNVMRICRNSTVVSDDRLEHLCAEVVLTMRSGEQLSGRFEPGPDDLIYGFDETLELVRGVAEDEGYPLERIEKAASAIRTIDSHERAADLTSLI